MRFEGALSRALSEQRQLVVKQKKDWGEILTGFEARSRYEICEPGGAVVAQVQEPTTGLFATLGRWFFKGRRPFQLQVGDGDGLVLQRPFFFFFSTLEITDLSGRPLGTIEQRFGLRRRFEVLDAQGTTLAWIIGPLLHPWTFVVHEGTDDGPEIGRIEKKWDGLLKEAFTDADTFLVTLPHGGGVLPRLVLASALLIDFCYFENTETDRRGLRLLGE